MRKLLEATMGVDEKYYVNANDKSTWVAKVAEINKDFADLLGDKLKFVLGNGDKLHLMKLGVKDAGYSLGYVYNNHSAGELKAAIGTMLE